MPVNRARTQRLESDYKHIKAMVNRSDLINFEVQDQIPGQPPEKYIFIYKCRGISRIDTRKYPVFSEFHKVYVELTLDYPNNPPLLAMRTPTWHPNIKHRPPHTVCIDPRWWAASRTLDSLVRMIGEMIQYKLYHADNTPPYPIDEQVAQWVHWAERQGILSKTRPVDSRELLKPEFAQKKATVKIIDEIPLKPRIKVIED